MSDFEVLKELKVCYEYINDLLDNCKYISSEDDKTINQFSKTMSLLSDLYSNCYKKMVSNKDTFEQLKTECDCPHCKNKVNISDLINYAYVCNGCDENFYLGEGDLDSIWYFDEKSEKLDKSFDIGISYDNESKRVIIASEDSSGAEYDCDDIYSIKKAIDCYIVNYLLGFEYSIQIWETEEDRDMGESFEYSETYDNDLEAIKIAKRLFDKNNYACVEVIKTPDEETVFLKDSEEEQYYVDGNTISYVSSYVLKKYVDNWINKKELPIANNLLYCEDCNKFIAVDNRSNDCWVEEFTNKDDAINWLIDNEKSKELDGAANEI